MALQRVVITNPVTLAQIASVQRDIEESTATKTVERLIQAAISAELVISPDKVKD